MGEMATSESTAALRRFGHGHRQVQFRAARHPAGVKAGNRNAKFENATARAEAVMNSRKARKEMRKIAGVVSWASLVIVLAGAVCLAPVAAAAKSADATRVVSYRAMDRAEIENLQRWVAAGHEDWCKDARLVAAEELKRLAVDFVDDATELNAVNIGESSGGSSGAKKMAFEWTPLDGRATYRVTVEQFEWLLPIAGAADAVVWVPTATEIQVHE
jgi:hypothetical protein